MALTLFDHLKAITQTKKPDYWDSLESVDKKTWSNYMVLRFLSMDSNNLGIIAAIQPIVQDLEPHQLYRVLIDVIPKSNKFTKYIKADVTNKHEGWLVDLIGNHFSVSSSQAIEYIDILYLSNDGKRDLLGIVNLYGVDSALIKKLKINVT